MNVAATTLKLRIMQTKHLPGKHNQQDHGRKSASLIIGEPPDKVVKRLAKLGYVKHKNPVDASTPAEKFLQSALRRSELIVTPTRSITGEYGSFVVHDVGGTPAGQGFGRYAIIVDLKRGKQYYAVISGSSRTGDYGAALVNILMEKDGLDDTDISAPNVLGKEKHLAGKHDQKTHGHPTAGSKSDAEDFVQESAIKETYYHGAKRDVAKDALRVSHPEETAAVFGRGVYLTSDKRETKQYGQHQYAVKVNAKNPLKVPTDASTYQMVLAEMSEGERDTYKKKLDAYNKAVKRASEKSGDFSGDTVKTEVAKKLGYDALLVYHPKRKWLVVPDPSQLLVIEKHLPGRHEQKDHGRPGSRQASKNEKRVEHLSSKYGSVGAAKRKRRAIIEGNKKLDVVLQDISSGNYGKTKVLIAALDGDKIAIEKIGGLEDFEQVREIDEYILRTKYPNGVVPVFRGVTSIQGIFDTDTLSEGKSIKIGDGDYWSISDKRASHYAAGASYMGKDPRMGKGVVFSTGVPIENVLWRPTEHNHEIVSFRLPKKAKINQVMKTLYYDNRDYFQGNFVSESVYTDWANRQINRRTKEFEPETDWRRGVVGKVTFVSLGF